MGESPCWDNGSAGQASAICWIDSLVGSLWRHHLATDNTVRDSLPAPVGSIALCASGAVVAALPNGFVRYDFKTGVLDMLGPIDLDHPDVRLNDGKCDPWGNFIAGTMHINRQPDDTKPGGLYRLQPSGLVERIGGDFGLTNGPCFGINGRTLYIADNNVRTIWAYDYLPD